MPIRLLRTQAFQLELSYYIRMFKICPLASPSPPPPPPPSPSPLLPLRPPSSSTRFPNTVTGMLERGGGGQGAWSAEGSDPAIRRLLFGTEGVPGSSLTRHELSAVLSLTPSLPQPVKLPGWKMLRKNPFRCQSEKEERKS